MMRRVAFSPLLFAFAVGASMANAEAGVPAQDASAITIEDLSEIADIVSVTVSPDGRRAAYLVRQPQLATNSYTQTWFVVATDGSGTAAPLADAGEIALAVTEEGKRSGQLVPSLGAWSPDSRAFAFTRAIAGKFDVWTVNPPAREAHRMTNAAADVISLGWSRDGRSIVYMLGRDRKAVAAVEAADAIAGTLVTHERLPDAFRPARRQWPLCGAAPQDSAASGLVEATACGSILLKVSADGREAGPAGPEETGHHRRLTEGWKERSGLALGPEFSVRSTAGDAAWLENADPAKYKGLLPLTRVAARLRGKLVRCSQQECAGNIKRLWWSADGRSIAFVKAEGPAEELTSLYLWMPATGRLRSLVRSDDLLNCPAQGGPDGQLPTSAIICTHETWTQPSRLIRIDLGNRARRVLADPNPSFGKLAFTRVEKMLWKTAGGGNPLGHLVYPRNYVAGRRYPLVVVTYRSTGFLRGGTGDEQPIHALAQAGLFVLSFNMPFNVVTDELRTKADPNEGIAGFWKAFYDERSALVSIEEAIATLDRRGLIDRQKIGLTGLSTGASIVDQALVYSDSFAAFSSAYSNTAPLNYYLLPQPLRAALQKAFGGTPFEGGWSKWKERSPALNVERVTAPLLLQVADSEYIDTLQNFVGLAEEGKPVELHVFGDEYHVKWQPAHRHAVYRRNVDWFRFWLQDYEDSRPGTDRQFKRWRQMRAKLAATDRSDDKQR